MNDYLLYMDDDMKNLYTRGKVRRQCINLHSFFLQKLFLLAKPD